MSSTRRDLEEVKEELREERTRRQALQVSEQRQFNHSLRSLYATDRFSIFFVFLNCPSRRKCTVWSWDIKRDTGCLTQTCAPELLTPRKSGQTWHQANPWLDWRNLIDSTSLVCCTVKFYIQVCWSFFGSRNDLEFTLFLLCLRHFLEYHNLMCFLKNIFSINTSATHVT